MKSNLRDTLITESTTLFSLAVSLYLHTQKRLSCGQRILSARSQFELARVLVSDIDGTFVWKRQLRSLTGLLHFFEFKSNDSKEEKQIPITRPAFLSRCCYFCFNFDGILFGSLKCGKWRWKKKINMIQQEQFEKIVYRNWKYVCLPHLGGNREGSDFAGICPIFAGIQNPDANKF